MRLKAINSSKIQSKIVTEINSARAANFGTEMKKRYGDSSKMLVFQGREADKPYRQSKTTAIATYYGFQRRSIFSTEGSSGFLETFLGFSPKELGASVNGRVDCKSDVHGAEGHLQNVCNISSSGVLSRNASQGLCAQESWRMDQ